MTRNPSGNTVPTDTSFASPPAAYTVPEFCAAHRIARSTFEKLLRLGMGPRVMRVGPRTLISVEAARDWRARMEAITVNGTDRQEINHGHVGGACEM